MKYACKPADPNCAACRTVAGPPPPSLPAPPPPVTCAPDPSSLKQRLTRHPASGRCFVNGPRRRSQTSDGPVAFGHGSQRILSSCNCARLLTAHPLLMIVSQIAIASAPCQRPRRFAGWRSLLAQPGMLQQLLRRVPADVHDSRAGMTAPVRKSSSEVTAPLELHCGFLLLCFCTVHYVYLYLGPPGI